MDYPKTHFVKRKSDGKIFQIRLCKVFENPDSGKFKLIWQFFENGKWITDDKICSPEYNFNVKEEEVNGISYQAFLF